MMMAWGEGYRASVEWRRGGAARRGTRKSLRNEVHNANAVVWGPTRRPTRADWILSALRCCRRNRGRRPGTTTRLRLRLQRLVRDLEHVQLVRLVIELPLQLVHIRLRGTTRRDGRLSRKAARRTRDDGDYLIDKRGKRRRASRRAARDERRGAIDGGGAIASARAPCWACQTGFDCRRTSFPGRVRGRAVPRSRGRRWRGTTDDRDDELLVRERSGEREVFRRGASATGLPGRDGGAFYRPTKRFSPTVRFQHLIASPFN